MVLSQVRSAYGLVFIGGSKGGGARDARPPPRGSKFFHFHAVFGKNLKNNSNFGSWRTPLGKILDPPLVLIYNIIQSLRDVCGFLNLFARNTEGQLVSDDVRIPGVA